MSETPKPNEIADTMARVTAAFKAAGETMSETGKRTSVATEQITKSLKKISEDKKAEHRPRAPHLTQRPFHTTGLITLRDGMQRNVTIKKK